MLWTCKNYRKGAACARACARHAGVLALVGICIGIRVGVTTYWMTEKMRIRIPNKSAPANRRPAGQSNGSGEFQRDPCSRRAFHQRGARNDDFSFKSATTMRLQMVTKEHSLEPATLIPLAIKAQEHQSDILRSWPRA